MPTKRRRRPGAFHATKRQLPDEFPSSEFSESKVANKRRNNQLPVYFLWRRFFVLFFYGCLVRRRRQRRQRARSRCALADLPAVWKEREKKPAIVSAAFAQRQGKLYEVLSATSSFHFTGRRLLLAARIRFNANSLSAIEPQAIFLRPFQLLLYLSSHTRMRPKLSLSVATKIGKLSCNFIPFSLPSLSLSSLPSSFSPFIFSLFAG